MIKQKLQQLIFEAITDSGLSEEKLVQDTIDLAHPANPKYGDYATNIAFKLAEKTKIGTATGRTCIPSVLASPAKRGIAGSRFPGLQSTAHLKKNISKLKEFCQEDVLLYKEKQSPHTLAEEITNRLQKKIKKINNIKKVEAVDGFINFYLSDQFFLKQMEDVLAKKGNFRKSLAGRGKKVLIEFGQPNTHKLPHIGHFRSYVLGESLARLLEFAGFEVFRANYQGDVGLQVAKCLWAMNRGQRSEVRGQNLAERVTMLQEAYVVGSKAYEDNPPAKIEIDELNIKIYQKDPQVFDLWQETRQWSLDYYEELNKQLGIEYDRFYFESEAAEVGKKIVLENVGLVFKESQGAIIFEGSKHGLHDRVFITAAGNPTYEAKDLGLIFLKAKDFNYDLSLISTASEQIDYFKVVYQAASLIDKKLAEKFVHIPFGLVSLSGGKLSSREGQIVAIDELLENVRGSLIEIMKKKNYSQTQIDKVIEPLTIGAAKYSLLKQSSAKNIIFDIQESVSIEGNAGPYLQYTYARAKSILRKGDDRSVEKGWTLQKPERDLLKVLYLFPEIVDEATRTYSPNLTCNYLFDLAQKFNRFYEKEQVIGHKREEVRLKLVGSVTQVLKNGLFLLGIQTPERI